MITYNNIRLKADKLFLKIAKSHFQSENVFPLVISGNKKLTGESFSQWRSLIEPLFENSKQNRGKGYSVEWDNKKVNGVTQGIPKRIFIESFEDFLFVVKRQRDFDKIQKLRKRTLDNIPQLSHWIDNNLQVLLDYEHRWEEMIKVCVYFLNHQPPHDFYLRELPIEVHSKFIEENQTLLKKLLDFLLPEGWINENESQFVPRYGLRKVIPYAQIRILDEDLRPFLGYDECSLSLDDAAWLKWKPKNVFIIENQACFLTFPKVSNSVAIFGEGF